MNKQKWVTIILTILVVSMFLWSCTKEKPASPIPEYPDHVWGQNQQFFPSKNSYLGRPSFNPNNPYEIAGLRGYHQDTFGEFHLVDIGLLVYNWKTKEYHEIYRNPYIWTVRWGANGWIVFSAGSNTVSSIWKIKPDGDSLTRLTYFRSFNPDWNKKGDKLIFGVYGNPNFSIIADTDGNPLDTVSRGVYGRGTWRHDSLTACWHGITSGLYVGNPSTNTWEVLDITDQPGSFGQGAVWVDNNTIVYGHGSTIWKMDVQTKKRYRLFDTGLAERYSVMDYSEQLDKVLVHRADYRKKDTINNEMNRYVDVVSNLFLMNSDGTGVEVLEISF